jgi:hypothetical protein
MAMSNPNLLIKIRFRGYSNLSRARMKGLEIPTALGLLVNLYFGHISDMVRHDIFTKMFHGVISPMEGEMAQILASYRQATP